MEKILILRLLVFLDNFINNFLQKNASIMPIRLVKSIAFIYPSAVVRKLYLKRLGFILGENSFASPGLNFTPNDDFSPSVIIGENVSIGPNVTFLPNSRPNNSETLQNNEYVKNNLIKEKATIKIQDDVWIGAGSIIMPGVTIKRGSIIGAGAVVLHDAEEFCIYAGVPARKIRSIENKN